MEIQEQRAIEASKPLLEQWLDDYWYAHVQPTATILQIDTIVQNMFNMLLIMGDTEM